jgi:phage tail sheath protein FI
MALNTSLSPAITIREVDLSGVVPATQTSIGAFVGEFNWGPVDEPILIDNEGTLVTRFGTPSATSADEFLSAASFLRYSQSLQVVRTIDDDATTGGKNAYDTVATTLAAASRPLVKNADAFDTQSAALNSDGHTFISRYAGASGSSLSIQICPTSVADSAYNAWTYNNEFDAAPGTSTFVSSVSGSNDEMHVVVIDDNGLISGTVGAVLEKFAYVSAATDAKTTDGTANHVLDVVRNRSEYVHAVSLNQDSDGGATSFTLTGAANTDFILTDDNVKTYSLGNGELGSAISTADYLLGFDQFENVEEITVDFLIAPGLSLEADQTTVVNDLIATAATIRKDCVVVASPNRASVVGNAATSIVTDTVTFADTLTASSYLFLDNNYLKVYDKYNDQYVTIPAAASTAGIMANTDRVAASWHSPAGNRRGNYLGITSLAYSASKSQRDTLYKNGINPVVNIPGQGPILFGDKTKESRPSAFDRINVRRLFLTIERAIGAAARNVMFEFNDEFTRAEFVGIVEPFLRQVQGQRGISDFRVVCDETNNTSAVVDRNEFVFDVFVKPARSINYVILNFVAVRSGVDFSEVVGTV